MNYVILMRILILFYLKKGVMPTRRELAEEWNVASTNTVQMRLLALEEKGFILLMPKTARGIVLMRKGKEIKDHLERLGY